MIGPCFAPPALLEAAPATQSPDGCHNVLTLSCTLQLQAYLGSPLHDLLLLQGGHHLSLDEPCSNMRQLCHKKARMGIRLFFSLGVPRMEVRSLVDGHFLMQGSVARNTSGR